MCAQYHETRPKVKSQKAPRRCSCELSLVAAHFKGLLGQGSATGAANPILAIHDVGAGGLSNAFPELSNDAARGARFDLRAVPLEESGMAPKEIWCNESQERYVLAIAPESLPLFSALCER